MLFIRKEDKEKIWIIDLSYETNFNNIQMRVNVNVLQSAMQLVKFVRRNTENLKRT